MPRKRVMRYEMGSSCTLRSTRFVVCHMRKILLLLRETDQNQILVAVGECVEINLVCQGLVALFK